MKTKLLAAMITVAPLALSACGHGHRAGHHHMSVKEINHKLEVLFDYLDATADQRAQIQRQLAGVAGEVASLHEAHRRERAELLRMWTKNELDKGALRIRVDRKFEQLRNFAYKIVDAAADLHRILTPAQRAKLAKLVEARCDH